MIGNPDEHFMRLALSLAQKGSGRVSPNPMVGCVIVKNGKVIAKGYHKKFGGDHAEIDALKKIKFKAKNATMYVSLEPCHHYGKTPPCVDAVISAQVSRVVIAMKDPNPLTSGKSIQKLKRAGIAVTVGVCEKEARELNRFFIKWITKKQPYVIVKIAQSLDGKISTQKGKQGWITGIEAKTYVHQLRSQVDAILVGRGTVKIDDPQLNVRLDPGPRTQDKKSPPDMRHETRNMGQSSHPKRIILDTNLKTKLNKKIFSTTGGNVIFICGLPKSHKRVKAFEKKGVAVLCDALKGSRPIKSLLLKLAKLGITSVLVEGGAQVFTSFFKSGQVDEWQVITAPKVIGEKGLPVLSGNQNSLTNLILKQRKSHIKKLSFLGEDLFIQVVKNASFF